MVVTASSYVDEHGVGHVRLESDSAWATSSWVMEAYFSTMWARYDLYPLTRSGVGTLMEGGKVLLITISQPPKRAKITVGSFVKIFSFIDGGIQVDHELVWVASCGLRGSGESITTSGVAALVLFNGEPSVELGKSLYLGKLISGGAVKGYALGQRFVDVSDVSLHYSLGGVIFSRVVWYERPLVATAFTFVVEGNRSERYEVMWNGSTFTGPLSTRFQVQPSHVFMVEGIRSSQYRGSGA